ncbi:MAG: aminotransferase class I/II-fold pyridoxal phosphate-dependent enzyme [Oscillospiraceae bacterium]|nr:aminotransferase class I/II-fold pyridoxal phosphate-dependent enzyme [Oscillospiraceae bacterium]
MFLCYIERASGGFFKKEVFAIFSDKMRFFEPSVFVKIMAAIESCTLPVTDLSVGTPDMPPAKHILDAFLKNGADPENHKYALADTTELTDAAVQWYRRRFSVPLERKNICGLIGSQDGLAHLPLMLLDPGDGVFAPDPGYPMFLSGARLSSASILPTPLHEEGGYLVDYDKISPAEAHGAKVLIVSYPSNPLGRLAPPEFFEKTVWFAKKYGIYVIHDNAYVELTFDGATGRSFLETKGAIDVGVEFNSLSKSYNLTGARISFMLGNPDMCAALTRLKSNIDYGIFKPVQAMAVAALTGPQDCLDDLRAEYQKRRDALVSALFEGGWTITPPQGTMFVWAKLPERFRDSLDFTLKLLKNTGVALVPGISFGALGEGYVRIGLVRPAAEMAEAARLITGFIRSAQ